MGELVRSGYDEHCTRKTRGSVGKGSALKMSGDLAASKSRRQVQQSPAHVQVQRATFNVQRSTFIDNSDEIWTPLQDMAGAQGKREDPTNHFCPKHRPRVVVFSCAECSDWTTSCLRASGSRERRARVDVGGEWYV